MVIAIDGPAGAGKSTVAKRVAQRLRLRYLDTGAMYRCAALLASEHGLAEADGDKIATLLRGSTIAFTQDSPQRVLLNDRDVTDLIRAPQISEMASRISTSAAVRQVLAQRQMDLVHRGDVTLEGRDTTTVVAPEAEVKIFLTASLDVRARRRWQELQDRGENVTFEEIRDQIRTRDERDAEREESPLRIADGAHVVDTDLLTIDEVVDRIVAIAKTT